MSTDSVQDNKATERRSLLQRYRQAPWRVQRQWVSLFLLGVVSLLLIAALYLNVTVRAAIAGREIQVLRDAMEENARQNADYEMQLAALTTSEVMQERARALGFEPADYEEALFLTVNIYLPERVVDFSAQETVRTTPALRPEYRQSLLEWFAERIQTSAGR